MKQGVIYTAIFGNKDLLHEPKFIPPNFDFVCFTDNRAITSSVWDVRYVSAPFKDPVRCARYYKILTHLFLSDYMYSIWIDGNMIVTGDLNKLVKKYLSTSSLAVYNHANLKRRFFKFFWKSDSSFARNCIYKEAEELLRKTNAGFYMDEPILIERQIKRYREEGYPENNSLAVTMVLIRYHNKADIKEAMEAWWEEIVHNSRRDQLSFNYVAWKLSLKFSYIDGDPRYNSFFSKIKHQVKNNYKEPI